MSVPLHKVQRLFWRSLASHPGQRKFETGMLSIIAAEAESRVRERLQVYTDAYFWRLHDALAEDFPRVKALLGDEFDAAMCEYLKAYPSSEPSLRYLGARFADFLERSGQGPDFIADLARLEWARVEVFDAPDRAVVSIDDLAARPAARWPDLRLVPIAALRVVRAKWPVHVVWSADVDTLARTATNIRVWRDAADNVFHAPMEKGEAEALERMISAQPFASICESFSKDPVEAAHEAAAMLARWLEDGIISRIE